MRRCDKTVPTEAEGEVSVATDIDIDDDIELLNEQIAALRQLDDLSGREPVSDAQRYDLSIRWGTALAGRLRRLMYYSTRGMLEDADEHRFQALCGELRALSEAIERLGLTQPLFTDAPTKAKPHPEPR